MKTIENMDMGTTGNNYSARAREEAEKIRVMDVFEKGGKNDHHHIWGNGNENKEENKE